MVKYIFIIFLIIGCSLGRRTLEDDKSTVPKNKKYFDKYKGEVDSLLFSKLDTESVYEFLGDYLSNEFEFEPVKLLYNRDPQSNYALLKFYKNGCFNQIMISENEFKKDELVFNPKKQGYRGVFKSSKNTDLVDLYSYTYNAGPVLFRYSLGSSIMKIRGDSLLIKYKRNPTRMDIYKKVQKKVKIIDNWTPDW